MVFNNFFNQTEPLFLQSGRPNGKLPCGIEVAMERQKKNPKPSVSRRGPTG
jgi:hypothetical protein